MVRIVSDTSTMYSSEEARKAGFAVSPLAVTIGGQTYRELDEIRGDEFVGIIAKGHMPTSSQPAIGEVMELYEEYADDEILNIAMADGLSGTYQSAVSAVDMVETKGKVTVLNSETLCGPHRYMVENAVRLAAQGLSCEEIVAKTKAIMETELSFLMPADFDYLRRGGRLSPLVSYVGKTIRLVPVMTLSEDARQLVMTGIKRSFKQAFAYVISAMEKHGVGEGWRIYVTHAAVPEMAQQAAEMVKEKFPQAELEMHLLTPAFITQGGPGCVAIQAIRGE